MIKADPRHSGPRIFGSIIKDPPNHPVTRHPVDLQFEREWNSMEDTDPMGPHESVRVVNRETSD